MKITDLERFLKEDIGSGDISGKVVPEVPVRAQIKADESGYLAGLEEAKAVFEYFELDVNSQFTDGSKIKKKDVILEISGSSRSILAAERLALNFLGRMSGIASLTRECVKMSRGVTILGTNIFSGERGRSGSHHFTVPLRTLARLHNSCFAPFK